MYTHSVSICQLNKLYLSNCIDMFKLVVYSYLTINSNRYVFNFVDI